jgi:hypothetical protein
MKIAIINMLVGEEKRRDWNQQMTPDRADGNFITGG